MQQPDDTTPRRKNKKLLPILLLALVSLLGLTGIYLLIGEKPPTPEQAQKPTARPTLVARATSTRMPVVSQATRVGRATSFPTATIAAMTTGPVQPTAVAATALAATIVPTIAPTVITAQAPPSPPPAIANAPNIAQAEPTQLIYSAARTPSPFLHPASSGSFVKGGNPAAIDTPPPTVKPAPAKGANILPNGVRYGDHMPPLPGRIVRIASTAIKLDTPVYEVYGVNGVWEVAQYAAGHHYSTLNPGEGGNVVLSGHNNWKGEVFRYLDKFKIGDEIDVWTLNGKQFKYKVTEIKALKEVGVSYAQRVENGRVMDPTPTEQLTLITCWPYTTFTHRLVVVAKPAP